MTTLQRDIEASIVPDGGMRMWWLGQAGFAFKTPGGSVIYLDAYLSDAVERLFGFKRLSLPPIAPDEVQADAVLMTHEHADHLDPDAIPVIARNNPRCVFAGPAGCTHGLDEAGVLPRRRVVLEPGRASELAGAVVHAAPADHGELSPTALSLLLDFGGVRVLVSGDTSLRLDLLAPLLQPRPDIVLPCINGGFGNMDPAQAARLVQAASARVAVPCHFWTFAEQGSGDPGTFAQECSRVCPQTKVVLLKPGEALTIAAASP